MRPIRGRTETRFRSRAGANLPTFEPRSQVAPECTPGAKTHHGKPRHMRFSRLLSGILPFVAAASLSAQGTTTGAITGSVTTQQGQPVEAAQVQVTNVRTGFAVGVNTT